MQISLFRPEIGPFLCSSAPSATKYSRKKPVWQIRPAFPGVILPLLGCSCFCFVTFALHNLCSICAFGQKGGFHNPVFAFFTQNNMKSPRKPCYFQFSRFTGRYVRKKTVFPVPSPFFRLLPAPGRAAGRKKAPEESLPPAAYRRKCAVLSVSQRSTSQIARASFCPMSSSTCSFVSSVRVTFCRISRWSSSPAAIPNTRYTVSSPHGIPWG